MPCQLLTATAFSVVASLLVQAIVGLLVVSVGLQKTLHLAPRKLRGRMGLASWLGSSLAVACVEQAVSQLLPDLVRREVHCALLRD